MARRLATLTAELEQARAAVAASPDAVAVEQVAVEEVAATGTEDWWGEHTRVAPALRLVPPDPPTPTPAPTPAESPGTPLTPRSAWTPGPAPVPTPPSRPAAPARPHVPVVTPVLPVPGRHAARRSAPTGWAERMGVPDSLRGRVRLGAAHLSVVAVLVALASLVGAWWVVRGDPEPVPAPVAAPSAGQPLVPLDAAGSSPGAATGSAPPGTTQDGAESGTESTTGAAAAAGQGATVTVDVAGKVRSPGIAVLPAGSRVIDALEAAGGARRGVDLSTLNLARPLFDGEQVLVGAAPGTAPAPVPSTAAPPAASGAPALVNLNTASATELEELPQVGPVTAAAIVAWREEHGGFSSVDQLLEVDGIGEVTLGQIAPHATV